jgi:sulfide:quinone oxidoreductase
MTSTAQANIEQTPQATTGNGSTPTAKSSEHHQIVIVGGGAAGITVAAQLLNISSAFDIAIIEPSDKHYYQPGWTLVGGGVFQYEDTVRQEADLIPQKATWIKDFVEVLDPDHNAVITRDGLRVTYDYLVVCPGIQIDWHKIEGLPEALGQGGVTSNYSHKHLPYTWEMIRNFQGGTAIFTFPSTPIKCAGAPQKIMYLADAAWRSRVGVRQRTKILFCTAGGTIFGVPAYAARLNEIIAERDIEMCCHHDLKAIDSDRKEAVFSVKTEQGTEERRLPYDMIHVAPPMSAPDFIKRSPLAVQDNPGGWVDVHKYTLQHNRYPNVFSLGDASSLPTSRTAAAIRRESPVLVENLLAVMNGEQPTAHYDGYTCCPLVTGYDRAIMAEFAYDAKPAPSFPVDQTRERWDMWLVKRHLLPHLYWNRMLKGAPFEGDVIKPIVKLLGK